MCLSPRQYPLWRWLHVTVELRHIACERCGRAELWDREDAQPPTQQLLPLLLHRMHTTHEVHRSACRVCLGCAATRGRQGERRLRGQFVTNAC